MNRWAVFVSGTGSNLENFLKLEGSELKNNRIVCVYADKACPALEKAEKCDKPTLVLSPKAEGATEKLLSFLKEHQVDSIFLLGYMQIIQKAFLESWQGRFVNLHPSLLPKYKGLNAIKKGYDAGDKCLGASLHELVPAVDSGPLISQISFERLSDWSYEQTVDKMHETERQLVREYLLELEKI